MDCTLSYTPGQSVAVLFPGDEKKRYFSISSSPTEPGYLEITVKCDPDKPALSGVKNLKRGDALEIEGPFTGGLSLRVNGDNPLCFIAAGSGIVPFRSMVKYLVDETSKVHVWLFHSVKTQKDLLFREEFTDWSGHNAWFHYVPTMTQDFDDNWINETGRIGETLIRKHLPENTADYFLCGPAEFVKDIEALLVRQLRVSPDSIHKEKW